MYLDLNTTHQWPSAETYWEINPSELLVWQASPTDVNPSKIQGKKEQKKLFSTFSQYTQANRKVQSFFLYYSNKFHFYQPVCSPKKGLSLHQQSLFLLSPIYTCFPQEKINFIRKYEMFRKSPPHKAFCLKQVTWDWDVPVEANGVV